MARINTKEKLINQDDIFKKSNELSIAKMNQSLTLNQMRLFSYAIFSTQVDGRTEFRKHEFEKKFNISRFMTDDAMDDSYSLLDLKMELRDLENEKSVGHNVFTSYSYDKGLFAFKWNPDFLPHILELKEKYIITDLAIASKFRSGFSWILYDYMKAHYGNWYKEITKDELMELFNVTIRKTYQRSTSELKRAVLDVAIAEVNKHTELEVWYTHKRIGTKIIGFVLHWSTGKEIKSATDKQITLLKEVHGEVNKNMFDYMGLSDPNRVVQARDLIVLIKGMEIELVKGVSTVTADEYIKESLSIYDQLERLLENDGQERDRSFYYNWLEED